MNNISIVVFAISIFFTTLACAGIESHRSEVRKLLVSIDAVETAKEPLVGGFSDLKRSYPEQSDLYDCIQSHLTDEFLMSQLEEVYMRHISESDAVLLNEIYSSPGMRMVVKAKTDSERLSALRKLSSDEKNALESNFNLIKSLSDQDLSSDLAEVAFSAGPYLAKKYCA